MRTRHFRVRLWLRRRFRGDRRMATTTWAAITWCGRATWCRRRRRCWPAGAAETARRALVYLACTQKPDGGFAQNFWVDGRPYWSGEQLDEVAFPIILAWRLWKANGLGDIEIFPFVERAAGFLVRHAPITHQERWEENAGYSPSTLAAVIGGLICAAEIGASSRLDRVGGVPGGVCRLDRAASGRLDGYQRGRAAARMSSGITCASGRRSRARPTPAKTAATR